MVSVISIFVKSENGRENITIFLKIGGKSRNPVNFQERKSAHVFGIIVLQ